LRLIGLCGVMDKFVAFGWFISFGITVRAPADNCKWNERPGGGIGSSVPFTTGKF
jgi:hypothetical protein